MRTSRRSRPSSAQCGAICCTDNRFERQAYDLHKSASGTNTTHFRTGASMRALIAILALVIVAACGPRQVDVSTGASASTQSQPSLTVTNNYSEPVQIFV